eukprot:Sspe_Gene.111900::Locus_94076_Transcript_1_1_Confidence_1.000_Length_1107::g.111900::m.111900
MKRGDSFPFLLLSVFCTARQPSPLLPYSERPRLPPLPPLPLSRREGVGRGEDPPLLRWTRVCSEPSLFIFHSFPLLRLHGVVVCPEKTKENKRKSSTTKSHTPPISRPKPRKRPTHFGCRASPPFPLALDCLVVVLLLLFFFFFVAMCAVYTTSPFSSCIRIREVVPWVRIPFSQSYIHSFSFTA